MNVPLNDFCHVDLACVMPVCGGHSAGASLALTLHIDGVWRSACIPTTVSLFTIPYAAQSVAIRVSIKFTELRNRFSIRS